MRPMLIAGNWKMNADITEAATLAREIATGYMALKALPELAAVICPPFTSIDAVAKETAGSSLLVGAQNCHHEMQGAFTGEVSPAMLAAIGAQYVILGHSERREYFGETNAAINAKIKSAMSAALTPIYCIGEHKEDRESGRTIDVIDVQLREGLYGINPNAAESLVIAYEPVWAIGTGLSATPEQAQQTHSDIRTILTDILGSQARDMRILYGGSMNPENAGALLRNNDVDGGLVGGASLKAGSFLKIISTAHDIVTDCY